MLSRRALLALRRRMATSTSASAATQSASSRTPVEDHIRSTLTSSLSPPPTTLQIRNDSSKHAHHAAMRSQPTPGPELTRETHFHVTVVSDAFEGKMQPARHRIVYGLLKEEMSREGGIHALQLVTRTVEEAAKIEAKKKGEVGN